MIKFWKLLSIPIVLAVCLGLMLVPLALPGQVAADNGYNVTCAVEDAIGGSTIYATENNPFTMYAVIDNPDGYDVFEHAIELDFDTSYFTVDSVTLVDFPSDMGAPEIDNVTGTITYDPLFGTGDVPPSTNATDITSVRINCTAKAKEGVSTVSWVYKPPPPPPPRYTKVIGGPYGDDMIGGNMSKMFNGTVIIGDAFNLTVTSTGCCPINVSGGRGTVGPGNSTSFIVPCSESVTLTANAGACCVFDNWTLDGTPDTNPLTVSGMAANSTPIAIASCSVPVYNLTMEVSGNGTTTPASGTTSTYDCGVEAPITATANASWRFVNWTTTGDITKIDDPTANSTTVTMDENKTVTANFVERFTLTMAVTNNGTTDPVEGDHDYDNGTVVNLTAIPDACWDFVNWTGDVDDPNSTSTNVTVDANKTVIAHFAQVNYTLNITSTAGGVTEPAEGDYSYINCTVVNLTATPDTDYVFVHWSGDVSTIADVNSSATNITMTGNYSIMAHFAPQGISALPISLTFTTTEGENPPAQAIEICNTGNGTLNWSLTDNAGWLSESPTSGSLAEDECEPVTVSVNVAGMEAGDYTATITITGSLVLEVPVSLHIESAMMPIPGGPAGLSASALSITPQQVQPGQDVTISISVANTGGATGSYNAVLYINSVVEDSQSVSVAAGASKNVIFTVSKSQAGVYDVSLAGQSGQFEVVGTGWFGGGLGTGGIIAIVVVVIILIVAVVFILRGTRREV